MANTIILLKRSETPSAAPDPGDLANGEIALNYNDGFLFYKAANSTVKQLNHVPDFYGSINVAGTFIIADTLDDILTINEGENVNLTVDDANDSFSIAADISPAFDAANTAQSDATEALTRSSDAFDTANSASGGAAVYVGNNGFTGDLTNGYDDIFRINRNELTANVEIASNTNASAAGPLTIADGRTLTAQTDARIVIL